MKSVRLTRCLLPNARKFFGLRLPSGGCLCFVLHFLHGCTVFFEPFALYLYPLSGKKDEKVILIQNQGNFHLYKIFEINEQPYALCADFKRIRIYRFDIENLCLGEKECEFNFEFTENVYVRDKRLYLFQARRVNDVNYTWYDFETHEQGEIINVKYENVIKEK